MNSTTSWPRKSHPGSIDGIFDDKICGWAVDPDRPARANDLDLEFSGGIKRRFATHYSRPDLAILGYTENLAAFAFPLADITRQEIEAMLLADKAAGGGGEGVDCAIFSRASQCYLDNSPLRIPREQLVAAVFGHGQPGSVEGAIDDIGDRGVLGWCRERGAEEAILISVRIDGRLIAVQRADRFRADVELVFGPKTGNCGFQVPIPAALFDGKTHTVLVEDFMRARPLGPVKSFVFSPPLNTATRPTLTDELRDFLRRGHELLERFEREAHPAAAELDSWDHVFKTWHRTPPDVLERQRLMQSRLAYRPLITVVIPSYNTVKWMLIEAIESVFAQTYDNWELIITDDASTDDGVIDTLKQFAATNPDRMKVLFGEANVGIAANTNRALDIAEGDYVAFFDHDDVIEPDALFAFAEALQLSRFKLMYTDEDSVTLSNTHVYPHFKPGWDPVLLAGLNYICHFVVIERDLLRRAGFLDPAFDGAQDKELLLRIAELISDEEVLHIPRVLYHWRHHVSSFSKTSKSVEGLAEKTIAVTRAWGARHFAAARYTMATPAAMFAVHCRPSLDTAGAPKVSVVIPTKDRAELIADCTLSLMKSSYPDLEILIIDHESEQSISNNLFRILEQMKAARVIRYRGEFNWSAINNFAASRATGDYLLFLNNDTVMISPDAIEQMVAFARMEGIGVVGARLLYADGRTQHTGVVLGPSGIAAHCFGGLDGDDPGYIGLAKLTRSVAAVTGACLLIRRDLFDAVGGFDFATMAVAFSDVDLCLKVLVRGLRNVVVTTAEFYHYESLTRGSDETQANRDRFTAESAAFRKKWKHLIDADPFYNPNFEVYGTPYQRLRVRCSPDYIYRYQAKMALDRAAASTEPTVARLRLAQAS